MEMSVFGSTKTSQSNSNMDGLVQPSLHGEVYHISGTSFAATVLTFEAIPIASILPKPDSSKPVYAHHVVLCPLKAQTSGVTSTGVYSFAAVWARISKLPSGQRCFLSGTTVGVLQMGQFLSEIAYRKKYGPIANLHHALLATGKLSSPSQWRLIRETKYNQWAPIRMRSIHYTTSTRETELELSDEADRFFRSKLIDMLGALCSSLEPILID